MPTVLRVGPYRFFFYSGDGGEPPHVHVERNDGMAKFWLNPVRWQNSSGLKSSELKEVQALVEEHQERLLEAWNEYFSQ